MIPMMSRMSGILMYGILSASPECYFFVKHAKNSSESSENSKSTEPFSALLDLLISKV